MNLKQKKKLFKKKKSKIPYYFFHFPAIQTQKKKIGSPNATLICSLMMVLDARMMCHV